MLIGARCNVNEATVVSTAQVLGGLDWPQASSLKAMVCILQDKYTPLHWAAMHGHAAVCQVLVTAGSEVNAANSVSTSSTSPVCVLFSWLVLTTGRTLPCCVCSCPCCNALCVRLQDMCTALHLAAQHGHSVACEALVTTGGAKLDAINKVGVHRGRSVMGQFSSRRWGWPCCRRLAAHRCTWRSRTGMRRCALCSVTWRSVNPAWMAGCSPWMQQFRYVTVVYVCSVFINTRQ